MVSQQIRHKTVTKKKNGRITQILPPLFSFGSTVDHPGNRWCLTVKKMDLHEMEFDWRERERLLVKIRFVEKLNPIFSVPIPIFTDFFICKAHTWPQLVVHLPRRDWVT